MALSHTVERLSSRHLKLARCFCQLRPEPITSSSNLSSRPQTQPYQGFHTSRPLNSALFNLGGLSTSRESQYLAKEHGLPRTEFSPHLELIRSSEVDPQQAPGSSRASSTVVKRGKAVQERFITYQSNGLVTISRTIYEDLQNGIKSMENRLERSEATSRQLLESYHKRTKEGMVLGGICMILALALFYAEEIRDYRVSVLQASGADDPVVSKAQEHIENQPAVLVSDTVWEVNTGPDIAPMHEEAGETSKLRQPWTLSRLFWVV